MPRKKRFNPTKSFYFNVPMALAEQSEEKMKVCGYMNMAEVCRELLRKWVNE